MIIWINISIFLFKKMKYEENLYSVLDILKMQPISNPDGLIRLTKSIRYTIHNYRDLSNILSGNDFPIDLFYNMEPKRAGVNDNRLGVTYSQICDATCCRCNNNTMHNDG